MQVTKAGARVMFALKSHNLSIDAIAKILFMSQKDARAVCNSLISRTPSFVAKIKSEEAVAKGGSKYLYTLTRDGLDFARRVVYKPGIDFSSNRSRVLILLVGQKQKLTSKEIASMLHEKVSNIAANCSMLQRMGYLDVEVDGLSSACENFRGHCYSINEAGMRYLQKCYDEIEVPLLLPKVTSVFNLAQAL